MAQKRKICRFRGVNRAKTWYFDCEDFAQISYVESFQFKIQRFDIFHFKIWHVVKMLLKNLSKRKKSLFKIWNVVEFSIESLIFKTFPRSSSKVANIKEECEEFATCVCMILGAACLFVGLFFCWLMVAVMILSFALPLHLFKTLLFAKKW